MLVCWRRTGRLRTGRLRASDGISSLQKEVLETIPVAAVHRFSGTASYKEFTSIFSAIISAPLSAIGNAGKLEFGPGLQTPDLHLGFGAPLSDLVAEGVDDNTNACQHQVILIVPTTNEFEMMVVMASESEDLEVAKSAGNAGLGENNTPVPVAGDTSDKDVQAIASADDLSKHKAKASSIRRVYEWKPKPARYDPENPPKFTLSLNILFAFVSSFLEKLSIPTSDSSIDDHLHGSNPILQPSYSLPDSSDVRCFLREVVVHRDPHAGRLCHRPALHLPPRRHLSTTAVHPIPHPLDSITSKL
jgi:hypothetical protein